MALSIDAQLAALRRMAASCQERYNGESREKKIDNDKENGFASGHMGL